MYNNTVTTKPDIVDKRSIVALLLLVVVLLAMHVLGSMRPAQSSLGAAARLAFDSSLSGYTYGSVSENAWDNINEFSNYTSGNSTNTYSSSGSDYSVSGSYYGSSTPSAGLSDSVYNDPSWDSTPMYANYNDSSWTWSGERTYTPSYYYDSSNNYSAFNDFYGVSADTSRGLYTDNLDDSDWNAAWNWNSSEIYTPTSAYNNQFDAGGWDYWYGSNEYGNNSFVTTDSSSYSNYTWPSFSSASSQFYNTGTSTSAQGVYVDNSFNYSDLYYDPTGTAYYNVPGTDYYGSGWGDIPTNTNYAINPSDYYYGSPDTYEYLDRCSRPTGNGTPDLYCGKGPSPTQLYATYGPDYLAYTRYATGEGERCSLKDGNCSFEETVAPSVRRAQSGAIIDKSVSSFYDVDEYWYDEYDVVYDTPRVQYYNTPATYRTVQQQTTTAPRVQYIQAPVVQQAAAQVQYVPTPIPTPVPVLSAPAQLSCDIRIAHNGNSITVYYLTSGHTARAYINNIGEVDPAITTAKTKTVYPPFANAYIMTVYGAQGQTANCTAVTPTYTPASVQYTTAGQSYTYQPTPQVYVSATQHQPTVDYVSVGELPYTGLEGTAYFFIVLFAAAASIGALFVYQEVFVAEASGVLTGMLGMKRFRRLGKKIETATHHDVFEDIPRDQ